MLKAGLRATHDNAWGTPNASLAEICCTAGIADQMQPCNRRKQTPLIRVVRTFRVTRPMPVHHGGICMLADALPGRCLTP